MWPAYLAILTCIGWMAACGTDSGSSNRIVASGCTAGQTSACACPGGLSGVQTCAADGTYGACECGAADGGGGGQQGRSDLGIDPDDGVPPVTPPDAGPMGSGETAEALIGPEGGTVELGGARLTVPAGALAEPTTLQITSLAEAHIDGYSRYSPVYRFEPAGTHFQAPATVSIAFDGDSTHAALFWSWEGATGYERIGGALANRRIEGEVTHFSDGFIADGIEYTDPPDPGCVQSRLIEGRSGDAIGIDSAVALFFTVDDCQGRPITGLSQNDFVLLDTDNRELSSEAGLQILPKPGLTVFATLVLDLSESTAPVLPDLINGAKTFVRALQVDAGLPVQIGIEAFAGDAESNQWQRHTLDTDLLLARLDALADYRPGDPRSTNLNGAVQQAYERIGQAEADFRERNRGGAFTAGYVVVFTDGRDNSGPRVEAETVRSQIAASPDALMMIGLAGRDYDLAGLSALEPRYIVTVPLADALAREFGDLARNRIAGQLSRTYLLGYCSTARANEQKVTVTVEGVENRHTAQFTFPADGFTGACRPELFNGLCGNDKPCGGLGCGACDDRTETCQESNRCENNCVAANQCGGQTIQNPAGYEQVCDNSPEHFGCDGQCLDTLSDPNHCGGCETVCDARGETCEAGACTLRDGFSRCGAAVVDLETDRQNCGACGHACAAREACTARVCGVPPPPPGYIRIEAGVFTMGSPDNELGRQGNETQHQVTLTRPFFLKSTETTQAEWQALMGDNPSNFAECGADCPVESVSWNDAVDYCNALSQQQGLEPCYDANRTFLGLDCQGYRLPTEAEWEYAARAGTQTAFYTGDITNTACDDANLDAAGWYCGNSNNTTHPGGQKLANDWGLYDMHGNVFEWVNDIWDGSDYPAAAARDPLGSAAGGFRVFRGGSWISGARYARSAGRSGDLPEGRGRSIGFRPARSP